MNLLPGIILLVFTVADVLVRYAVGAILCGIATAIFLLIAYLTWVQISNAEYTIKLIKDLLVEQGKTEELESIEQEMREQYGV